MKSRVEYRNIGSRFILTVKLLKHRAKRGLEERDEVPSLPVFEQ